MRYFLRCRSALTWTTVSLAMCAIAVMGAGKKSRLKAGQFNPDHETVELFAAMDSGVIAVKFIPHDATEAQVLIENKTQNPLNVKLPAAFAGVPVLAQFGPLNGNGANNGIGQQGGGQAAGQNQTMGSGPGNNAQQRGPAANNFFNVPAGKVGKLKVPAVCLEHGKPAPRAAIPYKIVPIHLFTKDPEVVAVCTLLGSGELDQRAAQFAAWHLASEMTVAELEAKTIQYLDGSSEKYFTADEIRRGKSAIDQAVQLAAKSRENSPSTGASTTINAAK